MLIFIFYTQIPLAILFFPDIGNGAVLTGQQDWNQNLQAVLIDTVSFGGSTMATGKNYLKANCATHSTNPSKK